MLHWGISFGISWPCTIINLWLTSTLLAYRRAVQPLLLHWAAAVGSWNPNPMVKIPTLLLVKLTLEQSCKEQSLNWNCTHQTSPKSSVQHHNSCGKELRKTTTLHWGRKTRIYCWKDDVTLRSWPRHLRQLSVALGRRGLNEFLA